MAHGGWNIGVWQKAWPKKHRLNDQHGIFTFMAWLTKLVGDVKVVAPNPIRAKVYVPFQRPGSLLGVASSEKFLSIFVGSVESKKRS
jgi:hypothetical protein